MKQRKNRADDHRTGQHTNDFRHLLSLWCCTQHVAGFEVLHHIARDGCARSHNGSDEQGRKHQVGFGHAQHEVADHVHQAHGEQQRGNGHPRNG